MRAERTRPEPRRPARRRGRGRAALVAAALGAGLVADALAQGVGPDLVDLALAWARGEYRAPLVCEFEGRPRRGLRRVAITDGPERSERRLDRITFFDLEAEGASRCFSDLGGDEPNLLGSLEVGLEARSRPDTARRDFDAELRRNGGFEYRIERGRLRIRSVAGAPEDGREVDFAGGKAELRVVKAGSDSARLLADFQTRRKLRLALEARDETRLVLHLVEWSGPPPR
jgi:hypothetical protein